MPKYLDSTGLSYYHSKVEGLLANKADASDVTTLSGNLSDEVTARQSADTALGNRISTLENAGYVTASVNNLTNYYTKNETYTQTEVNTLIGNIATIQIEVFQSLPVSGQSNIIYLVPNSGSTPNIYDEYIWVSSTSSYEKIGTTDVDLSGYVPTSRTVNGHALSSNVTVTASDVGAYTTSQVDTLLDGKVDTESGKGLSENDFTTTLKNKLDGIAAGAQVNVIETVKVNNTALTVTSKAVNVTVPTKVSDLTNDTGFITGVDSITNAEIDLLFA